ncbi:MAG: hypothetical protein ABIP50_01095 [Candidatus Saccharimonadales bacterium]
MRLRKGLFLSVLLLTALVVSVFNTQTTYAAQITTRSLTLQAGGTDGGSKPGGVVKHKFDFTTSGSSTGSIKFEYCTTASVTACVLPTGIVTTSATVSGGTGWASGATLVNTTNGAPYITKTAAAAGTISVVLNTVTNPTAAGGTTFFVRITTYVATNATGSPIDTGTVAASTAQQIVLTGTMPESLIFCVGAAISLTASIPDCTTATSGAITFNQLFSPTDTATAQSQMAASTNAASGYSITVNGATLTSGSNTIPAMAVTGVGVRGTGQFGTNLKLNTTATSTVAVGLEVATAPDGVNLKGQAATGYNTVDQFKFVTGDSVANSANGGAGPTNAQIFTSSYIVNVAGNQASGTYTATLTYICTATF